MLLCCAMLGTLCACQHGGDYEKRTYVPQFDMTVSYDFEDEELKSDDGTTYYRQSLGTATVSSKDGPTRSTPGALPRISPTASRSR